MSVMHQVYICHGHQAITSSMIFCTIFRHRRWLLATAYVSTLYTTIAQFYCELLKDWLGQIWGNHAISVQSSQGLPDSIQFHAFPFASLIGLENKTCRWVFAKGNIFFRQTLFPVWMTWAYLVTHFIQFSRLIRVFIDFDKMFSTSVSPPIKYTI